jgi:LPXTG-motif cell wall-anchored protein
MADITESQELAATCEENNTGVVIGIVIGLVVLVGGLFFLFKSKK